MSIEKFNDIKEGDIFECFVMEQIKDCLLYTSVAGSDTAAFLEDALEQLGLSRAEANEFIIYWLPRMQENA